MINIKRMMFENNYCVVHATTTDKSELKMIRREMWLMDKLEIVGMAAALVGAAYIVKFLFS
jgi:hypothetical protein